jgi:hypothetical protein
MDQRINSGVGNERPGATGIDNPETAQPSLRDIGGTDSGAGESVYHPHDEPVGGGTDIPTGPGANIPTGPELQGA